ncbi:hypothetical protein H8692_05640 [Mogibacterium sp. NSJ-24]|jgi:hypothetical protein|uniref:Uncharacterized protein n=1 Tax=Lentihominibacter hominis TaxID=2763645 RepID=A0A926I8L5_9FIRM|nr:hypothetical protein [Lentihominibacter hominis]MBC8568246.1 hypothetical protein [Lentihominibacter hominis]
MNKFEWEGKEYELAPKTLKTVRVIEAAEKAPSMIESYRKQWELVNEALGDKVAKEILGAQTIEKVDVVRLTLVYNGVILAYEKPLREMRKAQETELLDSPVFDAVRDTAEQVKIIENAGKSIK